MPPCVHGPYIPIECRWTLLDVSIVLSGFLIDRLSIPHISFLRIKINKNLSVRSIWILYILLPFGNCVSWTVFGFPFVFCCLAISRICARDSLSTLARIGIMSISAQNRHSTLICCLGLKKKRIPGWWRRRLYRNVTTHFGHGLLGGVVLLFWKAIAQSREAKNKTKKD